MTNNIKIHPMLLKQLKKMNLDIEKGPENQEIWIELLRKISRYYYDDEQERYLLERSMEISSREMGELNEKLEYAQNIAHLGYWFYDKKENHILWSAQTYRIFGIDPSNEVPKYKTIFQLVHEEDRDKVQLLIEKALEDGIGFETEFRIINAIDGMIYWVLAIGQPNINADKKVKSLSGIIMDITLKKKSEFEMINLHEQLIATARQAGMSEVATSILHNVGNVLNSVNTSISIISEYIDLEDFTKLIKISELIKDNLSDKNYLISNEQGKLIPKYFNLLSNKLFNNYKNVSNEVKDLGVNISHIKEIVVMQNDISGVSGVIEIVSLAKIMDLAIKISFPISQKYDIKIIKNYEFIEEIMLDKSKLLQIVINLIRNAKDSVLASNQNDKIIKIRIRKFLHDKAEISIHDNGIGILSENLVRIFSFGYTTKIDGHGFGLHSSAIAIKEMGGNIKAISDGIGKGATFIIQIPIKIHT